MSKTYPDQFLDALGTWQRGWGEDPKRREALINNLIDAIAISKFPRLALEASERCYRKRFLVKNNPQNGGDFTHLILGGKIEDGVTSWTTDYDCAKEFKGPLKADCITAIFGCNPKPEQVVLNIVALWNFEEFRVAIEDYSTRFGAQADALLNFKSLQSEVILDAPLTFDGIETFCGQSSSFESLCEMVGISEEPQKNELWRKMALDNNLPEEPRWLPRDAVKRVLESTKLKFFERKKKSEASN